MATSENVRSNEISKSESFDPGRNAATKRLQKELMELMMFTDKSISAFPESDNLFKWIATINGPNDTVYDGLKFKLTLNFSAKYPYVAPKVKFITHCFHPNINSDGEICLDILKDKWTALYDVRTVLLSIQSLLGEPNLDSPLDTHAAAIWGQAEFKQFVLCQYNGQPNAAGKK